MPLSSMTGFAHADGMCGRYVWGWELKSVNARGLELRLRLAPGWDSIETSVRAQTAEMLSRGTIYAALSVRRDGAQVVRVNESALAAVLSTMRDIAARIDAAPASLDGILALKGVIEMIDEEEPEADRRAAEVAILAGLREALEGLAAMRRHEGEALARVLADRLDEIAALAKRADAVPGRRPEAIKARLAEQVRQLMEASDRFDPDRLHQEAILIAAKVDVREEIDRIAAHVAQARHLLAAGGTVGRRLDFLAQELNREVNTLCSKSNDFELTNTGLELKSVVEQFREQVQNLE
jgi:uncharacterized protein (TIGR00255 family)